MAHDRRARGLRGWLDLLYGTESASGLHSSAIGKSPADGALWDATALQPAHIAGQIDRFLQQPEEGNSGPTDAAQRQGFRRPFLELRCDRRDGLVRYPIRPSAEHQQFRAQTYRLR